MSVAVSKLFKCQYLFTFLLFSVWVFLVTWRRTETQRVVSDDKFTSVLKQWANIPSLYFQRFIFTFRTIILSHLNNRFDLSKHPVLISSLLQSSMFYFPLNICYKIRDIILLTEDLFVFWCIASLFGVLDKSRWQTGPAVRLLSEILCKLLLEIFSVLVHFLRVLSSLSFPTCETLINSNEVSRSYYLSWWERVTHVSSTIKNGTFVYLIGSSIGHKRSGANYI